MKFNLKTKAIGLFVGIIIQGGWWAFFDGVVYAPDAFPWFHIVPGLVAVLSLIMLNLTNIDQLKQIRAARAWAFISLTLSCMCIGAAIWITAVEYPPMIEDNWPGVSIIVQTGMILLGSIALFIGRSTVNSDKMYNF
jgi:hypothetical protein